MFALSPKTKHKCACSDNIGRDRGPGAAVGAGSHFSLFFLFTNYLPSSLLTAPV